eukprot:m.153715 g.153715  ORF g.153715 m.153715 type:complete len:1104 (+) comp9783_c1_seq15:111-3422(+)
MDAMYAAPGSYATGEADDLSKLENLNEDILLKELQMRYSQNKIYTYVTDILVAVNPFKTLPIYGEETLVQYNNKLPCELPPHVYGVSDSAYHSLLRSAKSQCIIISGESGAGKTESAKYAIRAILKLCETSECKDLEKSILQTSPVLEAFGNAQTIMNDNSSRFGKYTRLLFSAAGSVLGIQMSEYLLERARVVEQHKGERNFHIFYYLFSSPNKAALGLTEPSNYPSLSGALWADNGAMYGEVQQALRDVGFTAEDIAHIESVLAAVLHTSNIQFDGTDEAYVRDAAKPALAAAARLLQVDVGKLTESLLVSISVARGDVIRRPYKLDEAYDCRDALAKALYGRLFSWIVARINEALSPELHKPVASRPGVAPVYSRPAFEIGVLDIFGFENFASNSFEQMCINLAHEQLQGFFNRHTFSLELDEYAKEGVSGAKVSYTDNEPLITMFLGRPTGLLALLDEESAFPKATDASLVTKLDAQLKGAPYYKPALCNRGYPSFTISHFPGEVEYNATHFLEKNRDNLANGIIEALQASGVAIVQDLFNADVTQTGQLQLARRNSVRTHRGQEVAAAPVSKTNRLKAPSLGMQFRNSLNELVERMTACAPHFIRCIKPNQTKQADNFVADFVRSQLKYTGVLETTRIRREGYPYRPLFADFVRRFKLIAFPVTKLAAVQENLLTALHILKTANIDGQLTGTSKLFLRFQHVEALEARLKKFYADVIKVQSVVRAHFARKFANRLRARAKMNADARARDAAEQAEKFRKQEEERMKRQHVEMEARLEESRQLTLRAQADKDRAEIEARVAEESRMHMEAAARKAEMEMQALRELQIAESARQDAERAQAEQARAMEEVQRAREERERALEEAELLRLAKEKAEDEAQAQALARLEESQRRRAEAEAARLSAEEKARIAEELSQRLLELQREAQAAKEESSRLEEQHRQDMLRLAQERAALEAARKACDHTDVNFSLRAWVERTLEGRMVTTSEVTLDARSIKGPVSKTGLINKAWKQRFFILSMDDKILRYYESDKAKKENGALRGEEIVRVIVAPQTSSKTKNVFMIETIERTYFFKTNTEEAARLWMAALSVFPARNAAVAAGQLN